MTNISEWFSRAWRWVSAHPRMLLLALPIYFVGQFAIEVWSIFDAIPSLPTGELQIVGVSFDGARFVELDNRSRPTGGNPITILVVLKAPLHNEHGMVRFEVSREVVDCSRHQIELHGASFYDDQGRQTITRVFDRKPRAFDSLDAETKLVCDHQAFKLPPVIGYSAALAQALEVIPAR